MYSNLIGQQNCFTRINQSITILAIIHLYMNQEHFTINGQCERRFILEGLLINYIVIYKKIHRPILSIKEEIKAYFKSFGVKNSF